jgi:hypothetical protein
MQKFFIVEGLDRCGKDTQIGLLQKRYFPEIWHVFHYSKIPFDQINHHKEYSEKLYDDMFMLMANNIGNERNFIFNRSHLGESVYAPLYRNYDGDYVFDIERKFLDTLEDVIQKRIFMITLVNDPAILVKRDDGLGFTKSEKGIQLEKERFERAYNMSSIKNKLLINCGTMTPQEINDIIYNFIEIRSNE